MLKRLFSVMGILLLIANKNSFAQQTTKSTHTKTTINNDSLNKKLDSLFSRFNENTPGVAITIIEDGNVIAKKAYGMASLEYDVPFSENSVVRLPYAETREFISIAAAMMEEEGLLSFNDKVRKYFPRLPSWSEPVTIQDLLNHSSGFVDEWAVLLLTQSSMGNRYDLSQFLNLLYTQPGPGIEPGKGYMYCNSDFGLLRLILEKASGENLADYMKRKIFDPFQMNSSKLHDNKDEVFKNFSHEYNSQGYNKYARWTSDKTSPGGNYFVALSAADLVKWAAVHNDSNSVVFKSTERLKKNAALIPGSGKKYIFGINESSNDGYPLITHQGVNDRPYLSRYLPKKLSVIVLGNSYDNYVMYHQTIMNWLVENSGPKKIPMKQFKRIPVKYSKSQLENFAGRYFDADTLGYESYVKDRKNLLQLVVHNDSLKGLINNNQLYPLEPYAPNVFRDAEYDAYMEFILPKDKSELIKINTYVPAYKRVYNHIKDSSVLWLPSKNELSLFTGKYYSPHLDFYWTLSINEKGKLIVQRPTISETELMPETIDLFTMMIEKYPGSPFEVFVKFHRDKNGKITHFTVSDPRLMHHRFDKI